MTTTPRIAVGQVWRPLPHGAHGAGTIRVVCRYPFADQDEVVWVVEHLGRFHRIERVPEATLLAEWHHADAVQRQPH